jgi:hypothetical protein
MNAKVLNDFIWKYFTCFFDNASFVMGIIKESLFFKQSFAKIRFIFEV